MKSQKGDQVAVGSAALLVTEGLSQLFGEHHMRVLKAAYRITGNMADAEDVAQVVFLRLASAMSRCRCRQLPLPRRHQWSARLAAKAEGRFNGAAEGAAGVASTGPGSSPEGEVSSRELGDFLRMAIAELAPRAAEMFTCDIWKSWEIARSPH